jgi:hypothetical protein
VIGFSDMQAALADKLIRSGLSVLLHQAVQRGLPGAVALVVERVGLGGPRRARPRARRPPPGDRHGGGVAQSGATRRR